MCYTRFLQEIKCFSRLHQATVYPQNLAWLPKSISYNHIVSHRIEAQKARVLARAWLQSSSSSWAHLFWRVPSLENVILYLISRLPGYITLGSCQNDVMTSFKPFKVAFISMIYVS